MTIILIAVTLLQLADWYSTRTVLKQGGVEQNPIMAGIFKFANVDLVLAIKTVWIPYVVYLADNIWFSLFIIALYTWVAIHNFKSL